MNVGLKTLKVPAKLHYELRVVVAQLDRSLGECVVEALVAWLEARRAAGASVPAPDCEREVPT